MKALFVGAISVALAGCVSLDPYSQPVVVTAGPEPTKQQVEPVVRTWIQSRLKDPDSLKQFEIINIMRTRYFLGAPIAHKGTAEGWLVCFQYNAKNSYGGYVGVKYFGVVVRMRDGAPMAELSQDDAIMAPRCN